MIILHDAVVVLENTPKQNTKTVSSLTFCPLKNRAYVHLLATLNAGAIIKQSQTAK